MNDLLRAIFGFPPNSQQGNRTDDRPPDNTKNNYRRSEGDDDDDDSEENINLGTRGGIFNFPLFDDSIEIHQRFQRLVNEMNKAFGMFTFSSEPSITWEDGNHNMSSGFNEGPIPKEESLRDAYLKKPDCMCDQRTNEMGEFNINVNVNNDFEPGTSRSLNSGVQISYPKVYSKSVFIQTVRKPDGTVEVIKKVRDHTGNEQTTITQSNANEVLPVINELMPKDDTAGTSIFRKFFPF